MLHQSFQPDGAVAFLEACIEGGVAAAAFVRHDLADATKDQAVGLAHLAQ
jgi:hypothetical protein